LKEIIYIIIGYLIITFMVYFIISPVSMFLPPNPSYKDSDKIIKITSENGNNISAVYLKNPDAKYTILFNHGNAEDLGYAYSFLEYIHKQGYSVIGYDYQGYGTSEGWFASEHKTYQDAQAVYDYLVDKEKIDFNNIIVFGRSIGCGPAIDLASKNEIKALILQSPFVTAFRVMTRVPLFPVDRYRNLDKLDKIQVPVMVIHGTNDEVIGFWHGKKIFDSIKQEKHSYWVEGAKHNDLYDVAGDKFWAELDKFISKI
jgi:abhydrolase domain-containing protein 17